MALHLRPKPNQIRVKMLSKSTYSVWSYGLNSKANCYLAFHDELVFAFVGALYPYKCYFYKKTKNYIRRSVCIYACLNYVGFRKELVGR